MRSLPLAALLAVVSSAAVAAVAAAVVAVAAPAPGSDLDAEVARLAKIGSCTSPSFSPDGRRLAFLSGLSGVPQVWTVATEGGWPEQVTALDDQVGTVDWSPDGRFLAFSLAPGGGLNEQVYLVRPDGQGLTRVTEGGKVNNALNGWSRDGRLLAFGSTRRDPGALDSYLYDVAAGERRLVAKNPGTGTLADLSPDGRWGLVSRVRGRGDNNLYRVDLATGEETLLTPHEPPATFLAGRFTPDGSAVYLGSNAGRDRIAFGRVRLGSVRLGSDAGAGGKPGPIEILAGRDDAELGSFEVAEDGKTAALLWNAGGRSELAFVDLATGRQTPGPALPGGIAGGLDFSRDGRLLAMAISGSALPSDIWVFDRESGRLRQVTHSPHAGVDLASLVAPELVRFPAADGLELSGWLYRPKAGGGRAGGPGPVVISFHGGPESQERPSFNTTYQALLARGIGVLAPNVRGSSGFGKRFVNLDNGPLRKDGVRDIKACVDFLVRRGIADPRRIGIMGGSYGGYMTMAGLTEYPDLFAAGADLYGIVNFETFFSHTEPWMAAVSTTEYGDPASQRELLRELSPLHKLDRVKAPTLVLHGANDTNVPVVEAEQVVETLKKRGVPVEYVLFPDEGHGFRKTANRVRSAVAIVRFFAEHLQGDARTGS